MRSNENYTPFMAVALGLTLAILGSFQLYISREPARIAQDVSRDQLIAVTEGRSLYADNCAMCHGGQGEGVDGPALDDKNFLQNASNATIFSLISSGVPGTEMPSWSQAHGGPFTDQQVSSLVEFIRQWEDDAPDRMAEAMRGDAVNGFSIFTSTCIVCHGENGNGTEFAPQLNNSNRLTLFDDDWFAETISQGRPSVGMPTWGTVLSPIEIRDVVALLRTWQRGESVDLPGAEETLTEALHMLGHGGFEEAEHILNEASQDASANLQAIINMAIAAIEDGDVDSAEFAIQEALELLGENDGGHDHSE